MILSTKSAGILMDDMAHLVSLFLNFPIEALEHKCEKCSKSDVQVASKKTSGLERLVQPCPSM